MAGCCIILGCSCQEHSRPSIGLTFHEYLHTPCLLKWKIVFGGIPTGGLIRESAKIMVVISLSEATNIDHFAFYRFTRRFQSKRWENEIRAVSAVRLVIKEI